MAVVGDSITFISTEEIEQAAVERRFEVRAVLGATSLQMYDDAKRLAADDPAQVVLNVGTNDAHQQARPEDTVEVVRRTVDLFPNARCVHVTTLNTTMVGDPGLAARVKAMNTGYEQLAESRPQVRVIDWNRHVLDYLAAGEPDGPLLSDTVHPTKLGQRQLAELYQTAVAQCR